MIKNNVHVFAIPRHTSHWLQHLDRGVFSSFKHAWQQEMKMFTRNTAGRKLEKKDFFLVFNPAFNRSVTVENSQGAFRGTGIFPFDMSAIPEHSFEPSNTTERELSAVGLLQTSAIFDAVNHAALMNSTAGSVELLTEILVNFLLHVEVNEQLLLLMNC